MTFPDTLPKLSERERDRVNNVLIANLRRYLPWSEA